MARCKSESEDFGPLHLVGTRPGNELQEAERAGGLDHRVAVGVERDVGLVLSREMDIDAEEVRGTRPCEEAYPGQRVGDRARPDLADPNEDMTIRSLLEGRHEAGRIARDVGFVLPRGLRDTGVRPEDKVLIEAGADAAVEDLAWNMAGTASGKHRGWV